MDDRVTLRPPTVCTDRGVRWFSHGVGTVYTPCSPVGLHAPDLGASSMASFLSIDAQTHAKKGLVALGHTELQTASRRKTGGHRR